MPGPLRSIAVPAEAGVRVVCFPHGGGSSSTFRPWRPLMRAGVELLGVDYPGHGARIGGDFCDDARAIASEVADALGALPDIPSFFFGHSLGSLIAFEAAALLERRGRGPRTLFASGSAAPAPHAGPPIHALPDDAFVQAVNRFNGVPEGAFEHPQLRALYLPVLRADFRVFETYRPERGARLHCPIVAMGGDADPSVPVAALSTWREATTAGFATQVFAGDHFYFFAARDVLPAAILTRIDATMREPASTSEPELRT